MRDDHVPSPISGVKVLVITVRGAIEEPSLKILVVPQNSGSESSDASNRNNSEPGNHECRKELPDTGKNMQGITIYYCKQCRVHRSPVWETIAVVAGVHHLQGLAIDPFSHCVDPVNELASIYAGGGVV